MQAAGAGPDCRVTPASFVSRETHPDLKPPAFQSLAEGQFGAMQFRNASCDGQAQAGAFDSLGTEAMKALAEHIPLIHRHAGAIVPHRQRHAPVPGDKLKQIKWVVNGQKP